MEKCSLWVHLNSLGEPITALNHSSCKTRQHPDNPLSLCPGNIFLELKLETQIDVSLHLCSLLGLRLLMEQ